MSSEIESRDAETERDSDEGSEEHDEHEETNDEKEETQEEESEEQTEDNSNPGDSYSPEPMIGDLFVGAFVSVVLVPLWASPLTGLISALLSSASSIGFVPMFGALSLASAVLFFLYLYSHSYR